MNLFFLCRAAYCGANIVTLRLALGLVMLASTSLLAQADNLPEKSAPDKTAPDKSSKDKSAQDMEDSGFDEQPNDVDAAANAPGKADPKAKPKGGSKADPLRSIPWQTGPVTGDLGTIAEIKIPAGYRFTGQAGARTFAELTENIPSKSDMGVLMPLNTTSWYIVFEYEDSGLVPDDEKGSLDAAKILASLKEGQDSANEERKNRGWAPLELAGWKIPPAYEEGSHHLVWGLRVASQGSESINYNTKILGRTGVMSAILVVDPKRFDAAIGPSKELLAAFQFKSGSKYAEWRAGDKVAQYGLTGLITGGLVVGAAKFGLLKYLGIFIFKFAKLIFVGVAVVAGAIGKFFKNITGAIFGGRKSQSGR